MKKFLILLALSALSSPLFSQGLVSDLTVQRTVKLTGVISPTQIAANTNDYAPTGFSTAYKLRLSTDASRNLTGLAGGAEGRVIVISNVGSFPLVLIDQSSSSTAANRFALGGADTTMAAGASVELIYDGTSSRWRLTGTAGSVGTVTHTGGALTSNAVVLGAGSADTKVVAGLFTDGTSKLTLGQAGTSVGGLLLANATSGTVEFRPTTGALGTGVLTVPTATDTLALLAASQTFTNKTLTAPVIATISNTGTLTLPTSTDTLVGRATTDTLTNKTLTSPKIGTAILDTNGNEVFNITATSSAVNEFTFINAATGNKPTLSATGGDTHIGISLLTKGDGTFVAGNATRFFFVEPNYAGSGEIPQSLLFGSANKGMSFIPEAAAGTAGEKLSFFYGSSGTWYSAFEVANVSSGRSVSYLMKSGGRVVIGNTSDDTVNLLQVNGPEKIFDTTASTSTTTGALKVAGGVGVAGGINANGLAVLGNTNITSHSGAGVEIGWDGSTGVLTAYDRTGAAYQPFSFVGSTFSLAINGAAAILISNGTSSGIRFNNYGAGTLTTDSSGNITATSDARAKNTIAPFTTGLAAIRQLQPNKYHWKPETGLNPDDVNVAVYAQDLIAAGIPEAVSTERTVESKNAAGATTRTRVAAQYMTVSDRVVVSAIINAVKELAAKNDALELRLATLEADAKNKAK